MNTDPALIDTQAMRLAAPAPDEQPDDGPPQLYGQQQDLDVLCERWVNWCRTRRLYGPAPLRGTILGRLSGTRAMPTGLGDAVSSAELSAFHIAYTCQPDALDKRVFDVYYVYRAKPIKSVASALGISDRHFYRLLAEFRVRVHTASKAILSGNEAARDALPHGPSAGTGRNT